MAGNAFLRMEVCMRVGRPSEFRALSGDRKFDDLSPANITEPLDHEIAEFLQRWVWPRTVGRKPRVMDFGCGRGGLVGKMRLAGTDAYGVDIEERFIQSGHILSRMWPADGPILSVVNEDGRTPFNDGFFDAVITDQVLEHVADLDVLAAEISRILRPGGAVFHRFPGRRLLVEPHYHLPAVHWLAPRSRRRRLAIRALVGAGARGSLPREMPARTRTEIIMAYADTQTFYRPAPAIAEIFARHGIALCFGPFFRWWLIGKLRSRLGMRGPLLTVAAFLLRSHRLTRLLGELYHWRVTGTKRPHGWQEAKQKPRHDVSRAGLSSDL
jgi:SAM-dependent methyltransferase